MRQASIPITDDETECNLGYIVNYRLTGAPDYIRLFPDPLGSPIIIQGLDDDTDYDLQVYRKCCDGTNSLPTETTFNTAVTSPV